MSFDGHFYFSEILFADLDKTIAHFPGQSDFYQNKTYAVHYCMSASPPKADMRRARADVR